jgi:hypothetical protein
VKSGTLARGHPAVKAVSTEDMKEAIPRAYPPIRQSDRISTLQEYLAPHETLASALNIERISFQGRRNARS